MSDAADFVDRTLQYEGDPDRASAERSRTGSELSFYGASVGAVRGTIRDALRRHPGLTHDEITALSSVLWSVPVFERRLAAVVLLQSRVALLQNSDLTRIEGFVREAGPETLVDLLALGVVGPLLRRLDPPDRTRAELVLARWAIDGNARLRRAADLALPEQGTH